MPSETTTRRENGLLVRHRKSWSECLTYDHDEYWVECPHCEVTLAHSEWGEAEEIDLALHRSGRCTAFVAVAAGVVEVPDDEEPF